MQVIIADFETFFGKYGRYYNEFYVGIAADPVDTLFNRHAVDKVRDIWKHTGDTGSHTTARAIEKFFLDKGAKGGGGGGDNNTRCIYTYKVTPSTRE